MAVRAVVVVADTTTVAAMTTAVRAAAKVVDREAVAAALAVMCRPLGPAAAILAPQARAMTDVTGFGLAGHLLEILQASGVGARLKATAIPLLPAALAAAEAGHGSSLAPANRAATIGQLMGADSALKTLLYDPQTGGGLLAAVPAQHGPALLAALIAAGEQAAIVGEVVAGPPRVALI